MKRTILLLLSVTLLILISACPGVNDQGTTLQSIEGMVFIAGATFLMGDTWEGGNPDEIPFHMVTISDFALGKYEVTFAE